MNGGFDFRLSAFWIWFEERVLSSHPLRAYTVPGRILQLPCGCTREQPQPLAGLQAHYEFLASRWRIKRYPGAMEFCCGQCGRLLWKRQDAA